MTIPLFRTVSGEVNQVGVNLRDTILNLQKRQDWIRNYLIEQGEERLNFIGKFTPQDQIAEVVQSIRNELGLELDWASQHPNWQKALDHLEIGRASCRERV